MRIRGLMRTPVSTVDPDASLHVAEGIMSLGGLRHLPVIDGSTLVGIVTHRDLLRAPFAVAGTPLGLAADARAVLKALRVRDVMTREVVAIGPEAMVQEAADLLLEHRVGCLPVLDRGDLVGIVTTSDLLRAVVGPYRRGADSRVETSAASHPASSRVGAGR